MSTKSRRTCSGCSVESHRGWLRFHFRALAPDGRRKQVARTTGLPDTPENREAVRRIADLIGAALAAGRTLLEIDAILHRSPGGRAKPQRQKPEVAAPPHRPTVPTVSDHVERWLTAQAPLVRKAQLADYRRHLRRYVVPLIGPVALAELQPTDTRAVQAELLARGLSVKFVRSRR